MPGYQKDFLANIKILIMSQKMLKLIRKIPLLKFWGCWLFN